MQTPHYSSWEARPTGPESASLSTEEAGADEVRLEEPSLRKMLPVGDMEPVSAPS